MGDQKSVAVIAMAIDRRLKWKDEDIQALYIAEMAYDISMMAAPLEKLTKPSRLKTQDSRLNDLEMKMVQGHIKAGYQILKDIPFPWPIAEADIKFDEQVSDAAFELMNSSDELQKLIQAH